MGLKALVKEAQNGDKEAFRKIFELASDRVFAYAFSRISNREDALDITQETFIDLWSGLKKFRYKSEEAFYGFVFTIAKRKLYKTYKINKTHRTVSIEESKEVVREAPKEVNNLELKIDTANYLDKQIASLNDNYRKILKMRYFSGMTFGEIANNLEIKEATAKVWHHRAIKKLKVIFEIEKNDITI